MTERFYSTSSQETENIAVRMAKGLEPGDIVALEGDLGAGKTAFVRGLAVGLGSTAVVNSPTYTVLHRYEGTVPLSHFDLYRLHSPEELEGVGFFDELSGDSVVAVEWPSRAGWAMPEKHIVVKIERCDGENDRMITISEGKQ